MKRTVLFDWLQLAVLFLLYLVGFLGPAFTLVFLSLPTIHSTGSPSVWLMFGLSLAVWALVSWQFFDAFRKKSKSNMLLSLFSIGGIFWASEAEGIKGFLMGGENPIHGLSIYNLSIGLGLGSFETAAGVVKRIALVFPLGSLVLLYGKLRGYNQDES